MIALARQPAIVLDAALGPRDDPLVALLEPAYRSLGPAPSTDEDAAGLLVAGDGSPIGQRRIFERAAEAGRALPPRFIPHRLSNGAASQLAIRFQHTGRVLTFADGPASLARAIAFGVASLESGSGPGRWIVLGGRVDGFDEERVRGAAVALELASTPETPFARLRSSEDARGAGVVPADSESLLSLLSRPDEWNGEIAFRDPAGAGGRRPWTRVRRV